MKRATEMYTPQTYESHFETAVKIDAPPAQVFDLLDDHRRLSAHMTKPSWMMAGSHMTIEMDEQQGRTLGSKISLSGAMLGLSLKVEEVVATYNRPYAKTWVTVGSPRLIVVGPYCMGFSLAPCTAGSVLRVFIDYSPPTEGVPRVFGRLFGGMYARWCSNQMARDAAMHFATRGSAA